MGLVATSAGSAFALYASFNALVVRTEVCESFCPPCPTRGNHRYEGGSVDGASPVSMYYDRKVSRILQPKTGDLTFIEAEYHFGVVADLDLMSRDPQEFLWRSYLKKGRVVRESKRGERDLFSIRFDSEMELKSRTARQNRSMELSELVRYNRNLIAFCDYSGIAYKIDQATGNTFQRWAIADGDGDEMKPFKGEWATVKDEAVWLGSIGFEWYGPDGNILHRNPEWVKVIDNGGTVSNVNWHPYYQTIRTYTNTTHPGYLWHEAVEWEPLQRLWVMLPRFGSNTSRYVPGNEHLDTQNMLIVANEGFTRIKMIRLQHHDSRYGFTSVKKLPGSQRLFMVLRVSENGNEHHTQAAILDLDGNFYTDPPYVEVGARKFEGLAFLPGPA